jgi:hypothetical protein
MPLAGLAAKIKQSKHITMKRYYFQIRPANVIECIWAASFTDAKAKAAMDWLEFWNQIEWLNPND